MRESIWMPGEERVSRRNSMKVPEGSGHVRSGQVAGRLGDSD